MHTSHIVSPCQFTNTSNVAIFSHHMQIYMYICVYTYVTFAIFSSGKNHQVRRARRPHRPPQRVPSRSRPSPSRCPRGGAAVAIIFSTAPGAPHFDAGQEDAALAHLKEHLSWRVQRGRHTCAECGQSWGEDTPMPRLGCSGCRVARFCSADHQKMASKKNALGGCLTAGRHKDICGVLSEWCEVDKDGAAPDSCTADLVAFLQRCMRDSPKA